MKSFPKILLAAVILAFVFILSSCSKNNFSHNYNKKRHQSSSSIDPVAHKSKPLRKTFIIPDKKKPILGQQKAKI
jgi:PBP1b-binding outer membrane lipoprotein LpoB